MPQAALLLHSIVIGAALMSSGCSRTEGSTALTNGRPAVLRIGFTTSSEEEIVRRTKAYEDLGAYLAQRLGIKVLVIKGVNYTAAIEAMRSGKIDVINASPLPYMVAHAKIGAQALVTPALPDGSPSSYHSIFVTRPGSGLRSMDDVKARSKDLVIAFADPVSTSGHLIPRAHLESMGLEAERDFKQVIFSGNHIASVMSAKSGKIDVATVTKTTFERMLNDGRLKADELVVLWTSAPLQQSIVFTRAGFSPEFRRELEAAYVDVHRARPDIWTGIRLLSNSGATQYTPITDSAFDEYRRIASRLEHIKLLD